MCYSSDQDSPTKLSQSLVEEALIVSDLFKLNELSALHLLLHGEEQLPQYPGLTRGLVAVILYYDGRKALVQALKILMSGRPGLTWSIEAPAEITDIVTEVTDSLMEAGLTETILGLLASLDWTQDLAGLQRNAALGDPHHVSTAQLLHADIKQVILQFTLTDYISLNYILNPRIWRIFCTATPPRAASAPWRPAGCWTTCPGCRPAPPPAAWTTSTSPW